MSRVPRTDEPEKPIGQSLAPPTSAHGSVQGAGETDRRPAFGFRLLDESAAPECGDRGLDETLHILHREMRF
jgi:hypothetical protein